MIRSQLIVLEQAQTYLKSANSIQYTNIIKPYFMSSAGAHMRHILDHYQSIIIGLDNGIINYDSRNRGGDIELNPDAAFIKIEQIKMFLLSLSGEQMNQSMKLSTEISISEKKVQIVATTLARELVFVSSHAIHHFAMIAQIAKAQQQTIPEYFGVAPATATFMRAEKCVH